MFEAAWTVLRKELLDALRDRRTLLVVLASSVALGPLVLVALSLLATGAEERAASRELLVQGIEHAPTLRNFIERQTYVVKAAPAGWERQLADGQLADPVLVIGPDFETDLAQARSPLVEVNGSSANRRAQSGVGRALAILQAFNQEQVRLRLALRGVSPLLLEAVQIEPRDLADPAARAAQLSAFVPFFVLMAVLYGALNAALDTTAGERERGSLEPLLLAPVPRAALVLGKWGAVAAVAMGIAVLSCLSFMPSQVLLRSESLAALFHFGWREALLFLALLLPLAAALSGVLMAVAIRCRSFKEAQANATVVVLLVSLLPLVAIFGREGETPWHLGVPVLAQVTLMNRVLEGRDIGLVDAALPALLCLLLAVAALAYVARRLRRLG